MSTVYAFTPLETVSLKTLFGIRFWDPVTDSAIEEGLAVTLHPLNAERQKSLAARTRSGVYAFHNIPGMNQYERESAEATDSPLLRQPFVVEVNDTQQRYRPAAFSVDLPLPYNGIFLLGDDSAALSSPPLSPSLLPKGFNLYSSISRIAPPQFTFVRGDLRERNSQLPAAHALVRVDNEEGLSWYGLADSEGKFSVMLPYPMLNIAFGGSPSTSDGLRLHARTWPVNITVMYEPLTLVSLPGASVPDYSSILNQAPALIYTHSPETDAGETSQMQAELVYGRDVVIKTAGESELFVSPGGSPA